MTTKEWFNKVFLKYLKEGKPEEQNFVAYVRKILHLSDRSFVTLRCKSSVKLRGDLWKDSLPIKGLINNRILNVKKGAFIWVREDKFQDFVTVETKNGCVNIKKNDWRKVAHESFEKPSSS